MKNWTVREEAEREWEAKIRGAYGTRLAQMRQELDAIAADAQGAALSRTIIEQAPCRCAGVRHFLPDTFKTAPKPLRDAMTREWLKTHVEPHLKALDPRRRHDLAWTLRAAATFRSDRAGMGQDLVRQWKLVIEMRNVPFETQRDILFFVGERCRALAMALSMPPATAPIWPKWRRRSGAPASRNQAAPGMVSPEQPGLYRGDRRRFGQDRGG
jgi:phage FluMu gp28-like protein